MVGSINDINYINGFVREYGLSDSDSTDGTTEYTGYVKRTEGDWYVVRAVITGAVTNYTYARKTADGTNNKTYAAAWAARATLDYGVYNTVF